MAIRYHFTLRLVDHPLRYSWFQWLANFFNHFYYFYIFSRLWITSLLLLTENFMLCNLTTTWSLNLVSDLTTQSLLLLEVVAAALTTVMLKKKTVKFFFCYAWYLKFLKIIMSNVLYLVSRNRKIPHVKKIVNTIKIIFLWLWISGIISNTC